MHPAVALVPALALVVGPRFWVRYVLERNDRHEENFEQNAGEVARALLDQHGLHLVRVESTDLGDHYDPEAKAVRLSRGKLERKTLTAVTTAAHEVSHALQDASAYGPFLWRTRLVKVARVAGEVGTVLLLAVPAAALMSRDPVPPFIIGSAALAILGTGLAAQLAALPSEFDASFGRALPLLRDGYISEQQAREARKILLACSLTYVASSLVAVLFILPWLGRGLMLSPASCSRSIGLLTAPGVAHIAPRNKPVRKSETTQVCSRLRKDVGIAENLARLIGKPMIRAWFRIAGSQ